MTETFICSLCLYCNNEYFSLFGDYLSKINLAEKISKHLNIQIKDNVLICTKCIEKIESFHEFYTEVNQKALLSVSSIETVPINDTGNENLLKIECPVLNPEPPPDYEEVVAKKDSQQQLVSQSENVSYIIIVDQTKNKDSQEEAKPEASKTKQENTQEPKPEDAEEEIFYESENDDENDNEIVDEIKKPKNFEDIYYSQFPKTFIEDNKLIIRGKELTKLISKFYRLECDLCPATDGSAVAFKKLSNLVTHYKNEHQLKGYVVCCGMKFVKIRQQAMHMARHIQPEAFRCPQCEKFMTCPKILQYHIQNHLPEEERPLKCPEPGCPRRFSYQSALVTHAISHMDESDRTAWNCEDCGKVFSSSGRLSTHVNVAHTK